MDSRTKASTLQHPGPSARFETLLLPIPSPPFIPFFLLFLPLSLVLPWLCPLRRWGHCVLGGRTRCRKEWPLQGGCYGALVPASRCQRRKGIRISNTSSCSFTASEQLPEQIRLPHTYSRLLPWSS